MTPLGMAMAKAPATVANVAVGFDSLGFAMNGLFDQVQVEAVDLAVLSEPSEKNLQVAIASMKGLGAESLPRDPHRNTASMAVSRLLKEQKADFGVRLSIEKGIPLSSGLGGSAASAVAASLAVNELLEIPLTKGELLDYALDGEAVASGARHLDNVAPSLLGGLTLILPSQKTVSISVPQRWRCVVWHPEMAIETKKARGVLKDSLPLSLHVQQSSRYAGFIAGCLSGDGDVLQECLRDEVIEPQRKHLIPGFDEAQTIARQSGAFGFSISGAGPTLFAWTENQESAVKLEQDVLAVLNPLFKKVRSWVSPIQSPGASLILSSEEKR